jgi:uncharacterized membrane protein YtjA (UPF0391 family)
MLVKQLLIGWYVFRFTNSDKQKRRNEFKETPMLGWAITFFIIALIAAVFGFGGIAGAASGIAQILFFVFLVLLVLSLVANALRGKSPKA